MDFDLERSVAVLSRTPRTLHAMLHDQADEWVMRNYGEATFSAFDVVGHLIHTDQAVWMTRIHFILDHGEAREFPAFDRYAMYEMNRGKSINELLDAFLDVRRDSLERLDTLDLTEQQLAQVGQHPALGAVTMKQLIASWVVHDLSHTHQIAKSMAYQYREAVGPWVAYLSILPKAE